MPTLPSFSNHQFCVTIQHNREASSIHPQPKKNMMKVAVAILLVLAMVQLMARSGNATITCSQVNSCLAPCLPYLTSGNGPSSACCDGLRNLKAITPATGDRQAACTCMKDAAAHFPVKADAASSLPEKCGVQTNVPISPTVKCGSIS